MIVGVWCPTLTVYGINQTLQLAETLVFESTGCTMSLKQCPAVTNIKVKLVLMRIVNAIFVKLSIVQFH